jgi:hypothetical protein
VLWNSSQIGKPERQRAKIGDTVIHCMKLLAEDVYLRPKIQVLVGLILSVLLFGSGVMSVMFPSTAADRFLGPLQLLGAPGGLYVAWYGYRKMKRQGQPAEGTNRSSYAGPFSRTRE